MVRECRPPAREPTRSGLVRRSTMATSTPASASSPATISPVGPPPAITTLCSVIRPPFPKVLVSAGDSAARPGSCHKPQAVQYTENGKERVLSFLFSAADGQAFAQRRLPWACANGDRLDLGTKSAVHAF